MVACRAGRMPEREGGGGGRGERGRGEQEEREEGPELFPLSFIFPQWPSSTAIWEVGKSGSAVPDLILRFFFFSRGEELAPIGIPPSVIH